MAVAKFEGLLHMVGSEVQKHETVFRELIPVMMKVELALQYLASGCSIASHRYEFRISENMKVMPPFFLM
jgi:hypothetical protein